MSKKSYFQGSHTQKLTFLSHKILKVNTKLANLSPKSTKFKEY